jgi:hypothetical protein
MSNRNLIHMIKVKSVFVEVACFAFIILFVYAGVSKLLDFQNFESQLGRSPMLVNYSSLYWVIPFVEIVISIFLAIQKLRLLGLYAAFSLMTVFTAYIVLILNYSEYIPCSCGGVLQHMNWTVHLWFNVIFVALAAGAILVISNQTSNQYSD